MTQSVSPAVVEYLQQVNAHMRSVCDVSYVEVANGLSGGYGAMAGAIKPSKSPPEFVDALIRNHALARIADKKEGGARQFKVRLEIGKAACRERVCHYVEIPGVDVSLQNKNN